MRLSEGGRVAEVLHGYSLIGVFLNTALYGVMITQVRDYYDGFPKDPLWMKIFVAVLLLAETLNSAFNMSWIYTVLVNHFGDMAALAQVDWLFSSEQAMAGIIATMVQLFFAWRLYVVTKNWWIVGLVVISSVTSGLCAIGTAIGVSMVPKVAKFQSLDVIVIPWLVACTVCDVLIALSLSLYLSRHKTGFQHTDSVVNKIIRSTVSSGLLTASCTIAHLVAFLATDNGLHMIFNYAVVKLYTVTVLSSLNSRRNWAQSLSGQNSSANMNGINMSNFVAPNRSVHPQVTINIETHEIVEVDPSTKHDPEWPDMVSTNSSRKSTNGNHPKSYAV
ncbi:hypothetical protein PHLGIDRAFT_125469 [Phlebiopsis gigantea 11061_1 CR5-6]|uniref:DUF6534 domain-containing protein n=1 Tax=Phlebiopsis gigantea (strain 11061_1 CR5-6) TaxID=745531 RepID=A0A0C3SC51_PHLG1|nr:hypothetical protein PHLGIDRAFT_125469 [Phlebiopsis gigantea 11061_1 CR5-6]